MVIDGYHKITCVGDRTTLVQGAISIVDQDQVWQSFHWDVVPDNPVVVEVP